MGMGKNRELLVLFGQKRMYPEINSGRKRSACIVLHVKELRTYLQTRSTKAERFAVETHHFKIQHAEITVEGTASSE